MDNSYYVNAQMKNNQWFKARIIDCRLSKDYDSKKKKSEGSYEYYIHYEGFNRRMDEWIPRNRIIMVIMECINNRQMKTLSMSHH